MAGLVGDAQLLLAQLARCTGGSPDDQFRSWDPGGRQNYAGRTREAFRSLGQREN